MRKGICWCCAARALVCSSP
uniref:Uncharacterized protein n=1 Tax=Arundo donax TaxID=35708 RepID=A0A0A8Y3R0_ARUDO